MPLIIQKTKEEQSNSSTRYHLAKHGANDCWLFGNGRGSKWQCSSSAVKENTAGIITKGSVSQSLLLLSTCQAHCLELMQIPPHLIYILKDNPIKCKFHS